MNSKGKPQLQDNPFEDPEVAKIWIKSVESEKGLSRDNFIYPLIKEWLSKEQIKRVLDIGAGQGITATLARGKEYVGLEPSEELVKRAIERYGNLGKFIRGSAYDLPFSDESFDGVLAVNVWFHLQDIPKASEELKRVLKENGQGLVINPNPNEYALWKSFYDDVKEFEGGFEGRAYVPGFVLPRNIFYTYSEENILRSFEQAKLKLKEKAAFAPLESGKNLFAYYILER